MRRVGSLVGLSPNAAAGVVAGSYLVIAGIYIFVSSTCLGSIAVDPAWLATFEIAKGLGFVIVTALILFVAVRKQISRAHKTHRAQTSMAQRLAHADTRAAISVASAATAHEMKNIITVLQAAHSVIRKPTGRDGPRADQMLDDMEKALERLRALSRDLMRQGSPAAQSIELIDLPSLLEEVARLARMLRRDRNLEVKVEGQDHANVSASRQDLEHAFRNLLLNAFEAGADSVVMHVQDSPAHVVVRVSDNGPGVPEEFRESLFEPFVTHKEGGTGLGLAVVRDVLGRHGGKIHLAPQESGSGATFVVELPKTANE